MLMIPSGHEDGKGHASLDLCLEAEELFAWIGFKIH